MKGHINLGHIQKFLCQEECLKCDVARHIWLEGKASLHWNLENNKRPFLSHIIDPNIKYGSVTTLGEVFYDAETIDVVKEIPKSQPKFDSYDYNSGLEKIIFYNYDDKDRNYRYFGNRIDLTRQVLPNCPKKRKLDSSLFSVAPAPPWSKNSLNSAKDQLEGCCKDKSTIRGLKLCGERVKRDDKPVKQETSLKHVLEQALKSIESRVDEPKAPSKLVSKQGVNFKGYHPSANHNDLFEKAFGKLPVFDSKSSQSSARQISSGQISSGPLSSGPLSSTQISSGQISNTGPLSSTGNIGMSPISMFGVTTQESKFPMGSGVSINSIPNSSMGQAPGQLFLPFTGQASTAGINPFAAQFPSGRRRGRGRR